MRGKKAKAIRKKLLKEGVSISSDLIINTLGYAQSSNGRKMYQLRKRGVLNG